MRLPDKHPISSNTKGNVNVMSAEQNRKVLLEELQRQKSNITKEPSASLSPIVHSSNNHFNNPLAGGFGDVHLSPFHRSALQVLQQANASSFGYFVSQDSHFGNYILPVLPRLEPNSVTNASPNLTTAGIKLEK